MFFSFIRVLIVTIFVVYSGKSIESKSKCCSYSNLELLPLTLKVITCTQEKIGEPLLLHRLVLRDWRSCQRHAHPQEYNLQCL